MPRKLKRYNMDAEIMAEVERQTQYYLERAPAEVGPPADAMKMNDDESLEWWEWRDPAVTPEMLAEATAQAADPDEADRIASVLLHPRRFELLEKVSPDPEEKVKAAARYRRMSDERKAQQQAAMQPMPEMGMPPAPVQPGPLVRVDQPQAPPPAEMFPRPQAQAPVPLPGTSWLGG